MFYPTQEQIMTAQQLRYALAFQTLQKNDFTKWKTQIIAAENYYIDERYYTGKLKTDKQLPEDRIIRTLDYIPIMDVQCNIYDKNAPKSSAWRFAVALHEKALAAGYHDGKLAGVAANKCLREAQTHLLDISGDLLSQLPPDITDPTTQTQTLLHYFCALDYWYDFYHYEIMFFNKHKTPVTLQENYIRDDNSLQKFLSYKRFIPIKEYRYAHQVKEQAASFTDIKGVWSYTPNCFLFEQETTTANGPVTKHIIIDALTGEFISHQNMEDLEFKLFLDFVSAIKR